MYMMYLTRVWHQAGSWQEGCRRGTCGGCEGQHERDEALICSILPPSTVDWHDPHLITATVDITADATVAVVVTHAAAGCNASRRLSEVVWVAKRGKARDDDGASWRCGSERRL